MKDLKEHMKLIWEAMLEKKALDPVILDVRSVSGVTDFFLICSGNTPVQVKAIADNIDDKHEEAGLVCPLKEGYAEGRWVLMDFGNMVVHVMHQTERDFYALEKLWHDAKMMRDLDELK